MNGKLQHRRLATAGATALLSVVTTVPAASALAPPATPASASASALASAATCSAAGVPTTTRYLRQLPKAPQAKAIAILRAASACDSKALVAIARKDTTRLSFGLPDTARDLAVPDDDGRYRALVVMFTRTRPTAERIGARRTYTWPLLHVKPSPAAWREVVKVGLLTQRQADEMRRQDTGYLGWRTSVSPKGTWEFNVAGD